MKLYYLYEMLRGMKQSGTAEILSYKQCGYGWHCVCRDTYDGTEYEMTIMPRQKKEKDNYHNPTQDILNIMRSLN